MNDIVYMLKTPLSLDGMELKYSLRSLKNIPHGRVFMVTPTLPDIVDPDKVIHISHLPVHEAKYDDLGEKWKWLGTNTEMTDNVTYMDDDYYILNPVPRAGPKASFQPLWVLIEFYERKKEMYIGKTEVSDAIINTMRLLKEQGINEPLAPCQHFPWPVKRSNIPLHWDDGNGPYEWKTIEFNHNNPDPPQWPYECKITTKEDMRTVLKRGLPFLSSLDGISMYTSGLVTLLGLTFPEKSEYERN